jgi:hypothetical protein
MKIKIILASLIVFIIIIVVWFLLAAGKSKNIAPNQNVPTPTLVQLKDSKYVKFTPGKTTYEEVIKALGTPSLVQKKNNKTYIFYSTKYSSLPNQFTFSSNGILLYDIENFFGDYKRSPGYYIDKYGNPEAKWFQKDEDGVEWLIFPKNGVALSVFVFENYIVKIVYFKPQTLQEFENTFLEELNLTKEKETEVIEVDPAQNEIFAPEIQNSPSPTTAP